MRIILVFCLLISTFPLFVSAHGNPDVEIQNRANPLGDYLEELDEMGRTLSGWKGEKQELGSWFFGSYAMLILRNNGNDDSKPFEGLETLVPSIWSDFKYLTPRYLVELAGGTLSAGNLMVISQDRSFSSMRTEEQFIIIVSGLSYLRMLQGTVGNALFDKIISATVTTINDPTAITKELTNNVSQYCGVVLGYQFEIALTSGTCLDVEIERVKTRDDSTEVHIKHKGTWSFPVDVLMITTSGDSTYYNYGIEQISPLKISGQNYSRIILDPEHKLSEFYRYNNKWPRIRDNIYVQPFVALPDWESYRIILSPSVWSDWDGNKRLGLKASSGFGVDLWPAYPSDYRHRMSLELNTHTPFDSSKSWGGRFSYGHPLSIQKRLFGNFRMHTYDDWSGFGISLTKYIGKQRFLIQGPNLRYQRLRLAFEQDNYRDPLVWQQIQDISILKASYSGLSLTRYGDRLYIYLRSAVGEGSEGSFTIIKSQIDLSGVFWSWLVGGLQVVAGTQSQSTPDPYQFTSTYAWQDNLAALPNFRGQSTITHEPNNYLGLSISGGYWFSWYQVKLFSSSMIYDHNDVLLTKARPHYTAGFGFEHKSLFTAGLYFPIWQSHPLEGENPWAWRYQWRLTWNL